MPPPPPPPPLSATASDIALTPVTATEPRRRIGSAPWISRVLLAPMAEITSSPFRRLCRELGAGCAVTEMSKARYVVDANEDTERTLAYIEPERPIGAQIVGSDIDEIQRAAEALARRRFDFIDINLGCSVKRILFEGCGGALLTDAVLVEKIVAATKAASGLPVTVKMRSGPNPRTITAVTIAQAAVAGGAAAIAIHPRFVSQGYGGKSDPTIATEVVRAVTVPVAVGGDVFSPEIAVQLLRTTGAAAVQFGRGVIGKPWVIAETLALLDMVEGRHSAAAVQFTTSHKLTYAWRHLIYMAQHYGPARAALMFRRHGVQYAEAIPAGPSRESFTAAMKYLETIDQARVIFTAAGLPADAEAFVPSAEPVTAGHRPPAEPSPRTSAPSSAAPHTPMNQSPHE